MDHVMMDATQAAAKMTWQVRNDSAIQHVDRPPSNALTNQGEVMMFHIDTGTPQDEDQDRLLWQKRPACNWDTGKWTGLSAPASMVCLIPLSEAELMSKLTRPEGAARGSCQLRQQLCFAEGFYTYLYLQLQTSSTSSLIRAHLD